ncbi:hypothetical protein AB0K09_19335 [Streptomyces sp. NPDC049577]|uniref:hypothetical protein n=1 Tax=Streptomyces sp. NPDC049577 TaxID=3155153 RepID=UPI00342818EE
MQRGGQPALDALELTRRGGGGITAIPSSAGTNRGAKPPAFPIAALDDPALPEVLAEPAAGRADEMDADTVNRELSIACSLNVEDLYPADKRGRITAKGGATEWIHWQSGTAQLLPGAVRPSRRRCGRPACCPARPRRVPTGLKRMPSAAPPAPVL